MHLQLIWRNRVLLNHLSYHTNLLRHYNSYRFSIACFSIYSHSKTVTVVNSRDLKIYKNFSNFIEPKTLKYYKMENVKNKGLPLEDVLAKLEQFAPKSLAESWDNVGLLVEPIMKKEVKSILLTNDLTEDVMAEAVERCTDLIISYHPPIFAPLKSVTGRSWKERIIATCLENKIAVYSPHTSFDAVSGGVNDWLASAFETKFVKPLIQSYSTSGNVKPYVVEISSPVDDDASRAGIVMGKIKSDVEKSSDVTNEVLIGDIDATGSAVKLSIPCSKSSLPVLAKIFHDNVLTTDKQLFRIVKNEEAPLPGFGMGRLCYLEKPVHLSQAVELVKKHIGVPNVRLALARHKDLESLVSSVALCAGSGSSVLRGVKADLYLTGEMQHHDVLDAVHKGSHVILCEHSNSERGFLKQFCKKLATEILGGNVEVLMSKYDRDPLQVV